MSEQPQDLRETLEARRDEIHAIAGVVGSGVSILGADEVIEVYVRSQDFVYPTMSAVGDLLGDVPMRVTVMVTEPEAQSDG